MGSLNLEFRWIKDPSECYDLVDQLFSHAIDPPVFYNSGMLKTYCSITGNSFALAVGSTNGKDFIALPLVEKTPFQNVDFPGWDNLKAIKSDECSLELEQQFWAKLIAQVNELKLVAWSETSKAFQNCTAISARMFNRRKCPYISLRPSWEEMNQVLSAKMVRNIRQYGNKASAEGIQFSVFYASDVSIEERHRLLEKAFSFHSLRMSDIHQSSKFTQEKEYHQTLMQHPENLFFVIAKQGGEIISCYYGLFNKTRLAWFNGGYSPEFYKYSIGTLLVAELISFAQQHGQSVFDFLRGNEDYKQKWTDLHDRNQDVYLCKNSWLHKVKMKARIFSDLRNRIGSKQAMQQAFA